MPSQSQIIQALQMAHFYRANPINGTGDPALTITYQFETSVPDRDFSGLTGWRTWTNAEKNAVLAGLAHIETFLNIDFVEASGNEDVDLSLGMVSLPGATAGYGGAWLSTWSDGSFYDYAGFATYDKTLDITGNINLILHELGHALGLDHPFDGVALADAYDTNHYSVMSYDADPHSGEDNDAMMLYDVRALQQIWGASDYNSADTTYTGPRTGNVDTVWDTGGNDTFDASARDNAVWLDLRAGKFSTFGDFEDVAIAFGVTIENAAGGSGDDTLTGNRADNTLSGFGGRDLLMGKVGKDTLDGGGGKDRLYGGRHRDTLHGGDGNDTLTGGSGPDNLWGDGGADTFRFRAGDAKDVIRDFETGVDRIMIAGLGTRAQVLAAATETSDHVVFDFADRDVLVIRNMTLDVLENDLFVL